MLTASVEFKQRHTVKAQQVLKKGGGGDGRSGGRKKARVKALFRDNFSANFDISQEDARAFIPAGASVWRAVTGRQAWCGHYPPMPRCSKSFGDGQTTCRQALGDVCIILWSHHIVDSGLDIADVPWDFSSL